MKKLLTILAIVATLTGGYSLGTALATVSVGDNEYPEHVGEPFIFDPLDPKNRDGICEEGFFLVGFISNEPPSDFAGTEICAFNEFECQDQECQNPDYYSDIVVPAVLEENNLPPATPVDVQVAPATAGKTPETFTGK